jgi:hypothetical protein
MVTGFRRAHDLGFDMRRSLDLRGRCRQALLGGRIVTDAVAEALKAAGFDRRKRPWPTPLGYSPQDATAAAGLGITTLYATV